MYKMPKLAIITILILLIGLNFCIVHLTGTPFKEKGGLNENIKLSILRIA